MIAKFLSASSCDSLLVLCKSWRSWGVSAHPVGEFLTSSGHTFEARMVGRWQYTGQVWWHERRNREQTLLKKKCLATSSSQPLTDTCTWAGTSSTSSWRPHRQPTNHVTTAWTHARTTYQKIGIITSSYHSKLRRTIWITWHGTSDFVEIGKWWGGTVGREVGSVWRRG